MKKKPLLRRLGASVSFVLLASALPAASAASAKHKPSDPKRPRAKDTQHGARIDARREHPQNAHAEPNDRANRSAHSEHVAGANGHASRFRQLGIASWYGHGFHGRRTANGEHFDMYAMTAAHRTLPLGSYVRVTSLATSKSVIVRINDRGPFARGRIIDLSYLAATELGMHRAGVAKVAIERVDKPEAERIAHRPMHLTTNG